MNIKLNGIAKVEWDKWGRLAETSTGKFRISVKMWYGKNMTLKYRYVNFSSPIQLKNWLVMNSDNLYGIVNLFDI